MEIKTYNKDFLPDIVSLWNKCVKGCFATSSVTVQQFTCDVLGKHYFEPDGLVLAFHNDRLVAFAHAGFKSSDYINPDTRRGTISMIGVEEGFKEAGLQCIARAIRYLFAKGARVIEAFTIDFPNTPFYNGLYGGEKAGMDENHLMGLELLKASGFNISNGAVIMTCNLGDAPAPASLPEGFTVEVEEWDSPMKGLTADACYGIPERIRRAALISPEGNRVGGITFWHLDRYNKAAGRRMAVVSHVAVSPEVQGIGAAMGLQGEVHRILIAEGAEEMGLGTGGGSIQAISFYRKIGYRTVCPAYMFHLDWRHYGDFS